MRESDLWTIVKSIEKRRNKREQPMIKLPKEVDKVIDKLNHMGFQTFVVGGSLRDRLMGFQPVDWDLATKAKPDEILKIFPNAEVLNETLGVMRLYFTKSSHDEIAPVVDIATFRREHTHDEKGTPVRFEFTDTIHEDLNRRDFTVNAMAYNNTLGIVDPFNGRKDIKDKIVRCVGDADERIKEDPVRILRALMLIAEKGFHPEASLYEAIGKNCNSLNNLSIHRIREEFSRMMGGISVGTAIEIMKGTGVLKVIAGESVDNFFSVKKALFLEMVKKIDKTPPVRKRRLGLFYSLLDKDTAMKTLDKMQYDKTTRNRMMDVITGMAAVESITKPVNLKRFIADVGIERYRFLAEVAHDRNVIFCKSSERTTKRLNMIENIEKKNEPIVPEDLAVDGNDIRTELGIDGKEVGEILNCLLLDVHRNPFKNRREILLYMAKAYGKSSLKRKIRQNKRLNKFR